MIESELPTPLHDRQPDYTGPDPGPPVLLKRLGNAVEANLAKNKLATAGIPSFLGGENTFAGDLMQPLPYRDVELYVPESMVNEALDVLEAPPADPSDVFDPYAADAIQDDAADRDAFRAFIAATVGCMIVFVVNIGFLLALPLAAYALFLAFKALREAHEQTVALRAKCAVAFLLSLAGFAMSALVIFDLASH